MKQLINPSFFLTIYLSLMLSVSNMTF